jgi:hypothetical protein
MANGKSGEMYQEALIAEQAKAVSKYVAKRLQTKLAEPPSKQRTSDINAITRELYSAVVASLKATIAHVRTNETLSITRKK